LKRGDNRLAKRERWNDWLAPVESDWFEVPWELEMMPYNWKPRGGGQIAQRMWSPQVDIVEEDKQFVISAEVAGMKPGEVKVTTKNGMLMIEGERETKKESGEGNFRRIERSHGKFRREIRLPDNAELSAISAKYAHGVLEVTVPKSDHDIATEVKIQHDGGESVPVKEEEASAQSSAAKQDKQGT